jgi:hypothetical protein
VTVAATVLAVLGVGLAGAAWRARGGGRPQVALAAVMLGALALVAVLVLVAEPAAAWRPGAARTLLVLFAALAVVGGGPAAVVLLAVADRESGGPTGRGSGGPAGERLDEGEVLRGGAWIGALERAAVFGTLVAGWPEGVAVVLAVKGVGRYQELGGAEGASERFIIGTFASVLWAVACAGVWWFGALPVGSEG